MTFIVDGTNGLTFPNSTVQASAGKVLQAVNATYSTLVSATTTTWVNTGLSLSITPKFSTSKLLVRVHANALGKDASNTWIWLRVLRDGAVSQSMGTFNGYNAAAQNLTIGTASVEYLDNATSTSSTTYSLQLAAGNGGTTYLNISASEASSITIFEIAQ
jgi:hypothetical protein